MPLDTSIPLNVSVPQFSVAPAQVGGPINTLTDVMKLQSLQREQQLNALKFEEYKRARAQAAADAAEKEANKKYLLNALRGTVVGGEGPQVPDPAAAANALLSQGKIDPALEAFKLGKTMTEDRKAKADVAKLDAENLDKQLSTFRTFAAGVNSPEAAGIYAQAMYDHPELGKLMQQTGYSKEQAVAKAQQDYATDPQRWMAAHVGLTGQQVLDSMKLTQKPTDLGGQISTQSYDAFGRPVGAPTVESKTLTPKEAAAGGLAEVPKLKPGERFNPETKTIEAIPGSDLYIAQSVKHEKDAKAAQGVATKVDDAIANINEMLSDQNKEGFSNNFGGYSAYATKHMTGNTAKVSAMLEKFKSNMKAAGLELFRTGGSIGAMTEREWPIVQNEIGALSPTMDEKDAREAMRRIADHMQRIKNNAQELYSDTWGQTQFYKKPKDAGPSVDDLLEKYK